MEDGKALFSEAKTLTELYSVRRKLLSEGMDAAEVNKLASERKKQLIENINQVHTLKRVIRSADVNPNRKITTLNVEVNNLSSGVIEVNGNHIMV